MVRGHPGFAQLSPEQQDLFVAGTTGWFRQQHSGTAGLQQPALGGQIASSLLNGHDASGSVGAGTRQAAPSVTSSGGGRDGQAQSLLPASQAAAAQAAADAFTELLRARPGSTLQAATSTAAPARVPALDSTGATLQGQRPGGQPALDMSVLERLQDRTSGKFYVVVHGSRGAGFFGDWGTCGVTGCSGGAVFKTFEFNQKSSGGKKYTSFAACEADAIDYLLAHERTPTQAAADLRAVVDARAAAATAAAREEEAHEEAERARRARERAEAAEVVAREAATREAAARARVVREHVVSHHYGCAVDDALRELLPEIAAEAHLAVATREAQRRAEARLTEERCAATQRRAACEAAAREALLHDAAVRRICAQVAAGAVCAVLARYPRQDRPDCQRSAAAKRRRRAAQVTKKAALQGAASGGAVVSAQAPPVSDDAEALRAQLNCERALRAAVEARAADRDKLLKKSGRRLKREVKTAGVRARQEERRSGKAKRRERKVKAVRGVAGAARKEKERTRKRKQPSGEPLHSGERKHRRLIERGGGSGGSGRGGGDGGRGRGGGGGPRRRGALT